MPVSTDAVGKEYPETTYEVGLEKIREYANAVGQSEPVHHDREAARQAGFRDVVVRPHTFHGHGGEPQDFRAVVREFVEILQSAREGVVGRGLVPDAVYRRAIDHLASLPGSPASSFTYTFLRASARA